MEKRNGGSHLKPSEKEEKTVKEQKPAKVKKNKRLSTTAIIVICVLLVILLLVLAVFMFVRSKLNMIDYNDGKLGEGSAVEINDGDDMGLDLEGLEQKDSLVLADGDIAISNDILNILLLGTDERDFEFSDYARADSIMLLSLNLKDYTAKLVSIERGIGVPILEGEYKGKSDWITHCFNYGGADLMMKEVQECFKVEVNRYVRVNLNMLIKVIDAIGGVDVELTAMEAWYINTVANNEDVGVFLNQGFYRGEDESKVIPLVEGENHLTGVMALAYSRLRAIDSDWHRIERQRTIIQACVNELKNADIATLNSLCDEILPLVRTNLTQKEITALMMKAPGFMGVTFEQMTIPAEGTYGGLTGLGGRGMFAPDFEVNSQILQEFLYGK